MSPLTTDDLQRRTELGGVAISPDGQWLAYVVKRPRWTSTLHRYEWLSGNERDDVWIVATAGGESRNLTHGDTRAFRALLGEGCILQSPADIRDIWQQIQAWFGELLASAIMDGECPSTSTDAPTARSSRSCRR